MAKLNKTTELIKAGLTASDKPTVLNALKKTRVSGNRHLIAPLLELYVETQDLQIKSEVRDMLCTLKISKADEVLEGALADKQFEGIRSDLLSFMWNSGMNPRGSILRITEAAAAGDFNTALEALTLLENMSGPFDETLLQESIMLLRLAIEDCPPGDKRNLLRSSFQVLSSAEAVG